MDKNLIWKSVLIFVIAAFFSYKLYPPQETLKPGIDLAGGTSMIYEIDVEGLTAEQRKGLAQNMIPILLKRIDPTNVANIVMRPQGDTRIEIQLPVASKDTQNKREAYDAALKKLEQENINLLKIRRALDQPVELRQKEFEDYANDSAERKQILNTLAEVYDLRKQTQGQRDALISEMDMIQAGLEKLDVDFDTLRGNIASWIKLNADKQKEAIEKWVKGAVKEEDAAAEEGLTEKQTQIVALIGNYIEYYNKYAPVTNELTRPEDGLNAKWNDAIKELGQLNLNIDTVQGVLEMSEKSTERAKKLNEFQEQFPGRKALIDTVVAAYDNYRKVGGRLDDPEDLKRMLKGSGVLEFRILPTREDGNLAELEACLQSLAEKGPKAGSTNRYVWREIEDPETWPPGLGITGAYGEKVYVLCSNQTGETMLRDPDKKWKLEKAMPGRDPKSGKPAIDFVFDDVAGSRFHRLTSENIGRPLCILLDDIAISAPNINSAIRTSGQITGNYSPTEQSDMVNKLNAGSFPARLSDVPISEKTISATIGVENRDAGIKAGLYGMAAVVVFLLLYYLLSGAIADVALALNILLVLGIMATLGATFTLPGIAGLILTIGMSVDANVLIFERIREEQKRGSTLKSAIANGYSRAFRTIFDANITTFGVAGILYMAASEEIKGFAIVLMLGIVSSMFTAMFVTRVIFDWLTGSRLITNHLAMPWEIAKNARINWMALRPVFLTISITLIVGGLGVFFYRDFDDSDNSKYDIEFIGGTNVAVEFKNGSIYEGDREKVQEAISQYLSPVTVYEVIGSGREFEINTTQTNKTTALLIFNSNPGTPETVLGMIRNAADESGTTLSNLMVAPAAKANQFEVSTSRVNISLIEEVLTAAVGETGVVSDIEVHEIVSDAIRKAFKDCLVVKENLGLTITGEEKIEATSEDAALLADYLGGVKLSFKLATETTVKDLESRLASIKYKPDMQQLKQYKCTLLKSDLTKPGDDEMLSSFVYVSTHPEAGIRDLDSNEWQSFVDNEKKKLNAAASLETSLSRVTQIDPSIGSQAKQRALVAIILSLIAIVGYIWIRFGTARYGFAAIAALVHDVCITLGLVTGCTYIAGTPLGNALGIQDFKIDLPMIAAFLTIIGYSLNDTIVVFDRIRENRGKLSILTPEMISTSINQTLSRTLLTSFTTFLVVLVMYIWGGTGLRGFTFALLVGIIVGTYSSIAIAAPILLLGESKSSSKK